MFDRGIGRKVYETMKFVLTAVIITVVGVIIFTRIREIVSLLTKCLVEDKVYMRLISLFVAVVVFITIRRKKEGAFLVNFLRIVGIIILAECILWHGSEVFQLISIKIEWNDLIKVFAGIGISMLAFILHLREIDY